MNDNIVETAQIQDTLKALEPSKPTALAVDNGLAVLASLNRNYAAGELVMEHAERDLHYRSNAELSARFIPFGSSKACMSRPDVRRPVRLAYVTDQAAVAVREASEPELTSRCGA